MSCDTKPTVCVVIPVHNGGENFRRCLSAISNLEPPPDGLVVVADADTDGSDEVGVTFGAQVIRLSTRSGPARARNAGARAAQADILFFVDADVLISPDAIAQVASVFAEQPDLAAMFGSYDDTPSEPNFLSQYKNLLHHYVHQTAATEASTFWAGCGAIRRDVFLSMAGFDERYERPCIEDIELGYRLRSAGYSIQVCKTLQGKHLKHWGLVSLLKTDFFQRALPWTKLILQNGKLVNDLNLNHSSRASIVMVYAFLGTLVAASWLPWLFLVSAALALSLLFLNAPVYRFFWQKRGLSFAVQAVPWHWLYYFYSGAAFAMCMLIHLVGFSRTRASQQGRIGLT